MKKKIAFILIFMMIVSDIHGFRGAASVSRGAEKTALKKPVIALAKFVKQKNKKPYILLKLKKTDGKDMQIYVAKESGRYRRLKLTSSKLSDYKKGIKIRYNVKNKAVSLRVRTYQKSAGRTVYSSYSEPVHITRQRKIVKLNKTACRLSVGNKTTLCVKGTKEKIKWSVLSGQSSVRMIREKSLVHLTGLRAGKTRVCAGVGGLRLTADIAVGGEVRKSISSENPHVSEQPATGSAAPETTVPVETTGPTETAGSAEPVKSATPAMSVKPIGTASAGVSATPAAEQTKTPLPAILSGSPEPTPVNIEPKEINRSLNVRCLYGGSVRYTESDVTHEYPVLYLQGEEKEFDLAQWTEQCHVIGSEEVAGYRWIVNGAYTPEDKGWLAAYPDLKFYIGQYDGLITLWDGEGKVNFCFVKYVYQEGLAYGSDFALYDVVSPYFGGFRGSVDDGSITRNVFIGEGNLPATYGDLQTIMESVRLKTGPAVTSWSYDICSNHDVEIQIHDDRGNSRSYTLNYSYSFTNFYNTGIKKLYGDDVESWHIQSDGCIYVYYDPALTQMERQKRLRDIKIDFIGEGYEYNVDYEENSENGLLVLKIKHDGEEIKKKLYAAQALYSTGDIYPFQIAHPCLTSVASGIKERHLTAKGTWECTEENMEKLAREITVLLSDKDAAYSCSLEYISENLYSDGKLMPPCAVFRLYMTKDFVTSPVWTINYEC